MGQSYPSCTRLGLSTTSSAGRSVIWDIATKLDKRRIEHLAIPIVGTLRVGQSDGG
jgi:hypothetical protein